MNINIYEDYIVMYISDSSRLSEENTSKYDNIFVEDEYSEIRTYAGFKLMELFSKRLKEDYISEFTVCSNEFIFEYFNYNNGENWIYRYKILESKGSDKE